MRDPGEASWVNDRAARKKAVDEAKARGEPPPPSRFPLDLAGSPTEHPLESLGSPDYTGHGNIIIPEQVAAGPRPYREAAKTVGKITVGDDDPDEHPMVTLGKWPKDWREKGIPK